MLSPLVASQVVSQCCSLDWFLVQSVLNVSQLLSFDRHWLQIIVETLSFGDIYNMDQILMVIE